MAGHRTLDVRVLAADPRSLDVRSTSRWTDLVGRRARRPIWPQRRRHGVRRSDGRSCRTGARATKNAARFVAQRESRIRSEGCHRRRPAASTPTWRASAAWTLRVDVGDSMQLMNESAWVEGGAPSGEPPRRRTSEAAAARSSHSWAKRTAGTWSGRRALCAGRSSTSNMRMQLTRPRERWPAAERWTSASLQLIRGR